MSILTEVSTVGSMQLQAAENHLQAKITLLGEAGLKVIMKYIGWTFSNNFMETHLELAEANCKMDVLFYFRSI